MKRIAYFIFLQLQFLYAWVQPLLHNPYIPAIFSKDIHIVI